MSSASRENPSCVPPGCPTRSSCPLDGGRFRLNQALRSPLTDSNRRPLPYHGSSGVSPGVTAPPKDGSRSGFVRGRDTAGAHRFSPVLVALALPRTQDAHATGSRWSHVSYGIAIAPRCARASVRRHPVVSSRSRSEERQRFPSCGHGFWSADESTAPAVWLDGPFPLHPAGSHARCGVAKQSATRSRSRSAATDVKHRIPRRLVTNHASDPTATGSPCQTRDEVTARSPSLLGLAVLTSTRRDPFANAGTDAGICRSNLRRTVSDGC
jgi:hypothetical protein